jgi:hypothetical protein
MADRQVRTRMIRELAATLPVELSKGHHTLQPKYNPARVGPELDQYGNPKDQNVIKVCSLNNWEGGTSAGVVVDAFVWAALPHIVDQRSRLATDEEIINAENAQKDFAKRADVEERFNRRGKYKNLTLEVA